MQEYIMVALVFIAMMPALIMAFKGYTSALAFIWSMLGIVPFGLVYALLHSPVAFLNVSPKLTFFLAWLTWAGPSWVGLHPFFRTD